MNGDNRARGWRGTKVERNREIERARQRRRRLTQSVCVYMCVREKERDKEREKRGPVEFRARYAIWRYRGQRLVRNTKLFMNGRKLSLKL